MEIKIDSTEGACSGQINTSVFDRLGRANLRLLRSFTLTLKARRQTPGVTPHKVFRIPESPYRVNEMWVKKLPHPSDPGTFALNSRHSLQLKDAKTCLIELVR